MIANLLRDLTPSVIAAVARRHRDFAAVEDAVQEALISAATKWPVEGTPDNPRGWLVHVALRRMTDHQRAEAARMRRQFEAAPDDIAPEPEQDDTLVLLFMCCHPKLTPASAIALTLRAVGGLTTSEIARAFMVPETTMAQRISRAKAIVAHDGLQPIDPARLPAVLHTLYLIFNEGYTAVRADLATEAIRLARQVHALRPDDAEVAGLLALMVLTDARRAARATADGDLVPLDDQDRTLWNRELIDEGIALVSSALPRGQVGPYQLQAAIAAVHDEATSWATTDWRQILALYSVLMRMTDNPMIALNRAVAVAMVDGPATALRLVDSLATDDRLAQSHRVDAVRGHLLEMAGDRDAAVAHYRAAASRTTNIAERNYLALRAARLAVG